MKAGRAPRRPELDWLLQVVQAWCQPDYQLSPPRGPFDPSFAARLADRHGLAGILVNVSEPDVAQLLECESAGLREEAMRQSCRNLRLIESIRQIMTLFKDRKVEAILLKGLATAAYYSNLAARPFEDLDILISPASLEEAIGVLRMLDFKPRSDFEHMSAERIQNLVSKLTFVHQDTIAKVDLHWQVEEVHSGLLPPTEALFDRSVVRTSQSVTYRSLNEVDSIHYLCIHGARHCWQRVLWLVDVVVLLDRLPHEVWTEAKENMTRLGASRSFDTALHLASSELAAKTPLQPPRPARAVVHLAEKSIELWSRAASSWATQPERTWYFLQCHDSLPARLRRARALAGSYLLRR